VPVHRAARAFDATADLYERARPEYPDDALTRLVEVLGIDAATTVVDLAAGTGKLTGPLVRTGAQVLAVEPIAGMCRVLVARVPGVPVLAATAEAIPLCDASVDVVTVGQAFHWFRADEALREIRRVLARQGRLGLIWNRRDRRHEVQRALSAIVEPYREHAPSYAEGDWLAAFDRTDAFGPLQVERFATAQHLDTAGLVERVCSISFVAGLPDAERAHVARDVAALAEAHGGHVDLAYVTDCFWCPAR